MCHVTVSSVALRLFEACSYYSVARQVKTDIALLILIFRLNKETQFFLSHIRKKSTFAVINIIVKIYVVGNHPNFARNILSHLQFPHILFNFPNTSNRESIILVVFSGNN